MISGFPQYDMLKLSKAMVLPTVALQHELSSRKWKYKNLLLVMLLYFYG